MHGMQQKKGFKFSASFCNRLYLKRIPKLMCNKFVPNELAKKRFHSIIIVSNQMNVMFATYQERCYEVQQGRS